MSSNGFSTIKPTGHNFSRNPNKYPVKPPWFVICNRHEAEQILRENQDYGNILIRPNSNFRHEGSYALSAATFSKGETKFVHYVVSSTSHGFSLEIQKKPSPMASLEDVLNYYITAAGPKNHHALVIDPTDKSTKNDYVRLDPGATVHKSVYMNIPDATKGAISETMDDTYLPMTGTSANGDHPIQRRSSAPASAKSRDYINMPTTMTTGGRTPQWIRDYENIPELEAELPKSHGDYVNVANAMPTSRQSKACNRTPTFLPKSNSFPVYSKKESDKDYDSEIENQNEADGLKPPSCPAPHPPIPEVKAAEHKGAFLSERL